MRVTKARITIAQNFRLQSPPAGWPERGRVGEVIETAAPIAFAMRDAGYGDEIEIVRSDALGPADPRARKQAHEHVKVALVRTVALSAEMAKLGTRIESLKRSPLEDPTKAVDIEAEIIASERAISRLSKHKGVASREHRACVVRCGELDAQTLLAEAETMVSKDLRRNMERAAHTFGPILANLAKLYSEAMRAAIASGKAALVERASATPTDLLISELLAAASGVAAPEGTGRP